MEKNQITKERILEDVLKLTRAEIYFELGRITARFKRRDGKIIKTREQMAEILAEKRLEDLGREK